jgi:hypothetical protein
MAKLQHIILLESERVNSEKILELKPLYDYAISIYKLKLEKTNDNIQLQSHIQIFDDQIKNLDDNHLVNISKNFLEKYTKNLEIEDDYAELLSALKKKFLDYKASKSEIKIISSLLTYDFQLIFLKSLQKENRDSSCLPADFDYLIGLNKCYEDSTNGENTDELEENPIDDEKSQIPNKEEFNSVEANPTQTQIADFYNYNTESGIETGIVLNSDEALNYASTESSGWAGIVVGLGKKAVTLASNSKNQIAKNLKNSAVAKREDRSKVSLKKTKKTSSKENFCAKKNILNLKDFIIDDNNYEYSIYEIINQNERISFYFIFSENLEKFFYSQSVSGQNYVFVEASNKKIFYEVSKKEISEGIHFTHNIQVFNQSFKFTHESNCDQNAHVFLTIDDSFNQLKIVLNVRFTKTYEHNFSKIFVINLAEEFTSEETKENMYLVFNRHFVTSVNLFKNFNFSYNEQISVIYKINQIILYNQANNLHNIELKNIFSNELIGFNKAKYEFEDKLFNFGKYILQKTENLNRINSKNLQTTHFPGLYSLKSFLDNGANNNLEKNNCVYANQYHKCLRCAKGKKLFNFQCFTDCPENTYFSEHLNSCHKCDKNCKKCLGVKCAECKNGFFLNIVDGICMDFCPQDTTLIKDPKGSLFCRSCDESCGLCDSKSNKCIKCKGAGFLTVEGNCVSKCPYKFYSDFAKKTCEKCDVKNCKICNKNYAKSNSISKNKCEVCESGFIKQAGLCVSQCGKRFYAFEVEDKKVCKKCPSECAECTFDNEIQKPVCSKCNLKTHKAIISENSKNYSMCESLCSEKNTILVDSLCVKCRIENCDKCTLESNRNLICEKCQKGFLLKNGECVGECGIGFYSSEFKGLCETCSENCSSCKISEESKSLVCEKCESDFYLINNFECIKECPEGFVKSDIANELDTFLKKSSKENKNIDIVNNLIKNDKNNQSDIDNLRKLSNKYSQKECKMCEYPNECRRCLILNQSLCEDCYEGYFNNNGICQHNCPNGYYKSKKQCLKCPIGCDECNSENTCAKCLKGFFYKNGVCLPDCEEGWTPDVYSNICKKCFDSRCAQCFTQDENLCQKCFNGYKLFENVCYTNCPLGYYDNNGFCVKCAKGCLDCESNYSCKSCDYNNNLVLFEGKCHENCSAGYYKEYRGNVCKKCSNKDCLVCDSFEHSKCKVAKSGTVIENAYYEKCPEYFVASFLNVKYNNEKYELLKCFKCPNFCDICEFNPANSKIQCLKCTNNFELKNGICIDKLCGDNQIKKDNGCLNCQDIKAKKCDNDSTYKSIECLKDYYLNDGKCLGACPEGRYFSKAFMECKDCVDNCAECINYNECNKCDEGFLFLENSKCVKQCPSGFSEDYLNRKCLKCGDNCNECDVDSLACNKCRKPFLHELGKCVLKCRLGFNENKEENICESKYHFRFNFFSLHSKFYHLKKLFIIIYIL